MGPDGRTDGWATGHSDRYQDRSRSRDWQGADSPGVTLPSTENAGNKQASPGGPDSSDIPVPSSVDSESSGSTIPYDGMYCKDLYISDDHLDWVFLTSEERLAATCPHVDEFPELSEC